MFDRVPTFSHVSTYFRLCCPERTPQYNLRGGRWDELGYESEALVSCIVLSSADGLGAVFMYIELVIWTLKKRQII